MFIASHLSKIYIQSEKAWFHLAQNNRYFIQKKDVLRENSCSEFQKYYKNITKYYENITKTIQKYYKNITKIIQKRYKNITKVIQK